MHPAHPAPRGHCAENTDAAWVKRTVTLITGVAFFRLLWLWLVPLDLVPDEAYYWDWGRQPAWCYFSKPPMIAWLNTLTQSIGFTTTSLQRVPAVILGTVGLIAIGSLARRLWGPRAGFFTVVLSATAPGTVALNSLLTIDAPLIACWSVALYALWRALEPATDDSRANRTGWWLLYAVAGLLGVLSKQMMLVLPLLALIFVWTSPADRAWRRRAAIYAWLAVPLLALIPIIAWNIRHDWITAQHTAHHFQAEPWTLLRSLKFFGEYLGGQLGLAGPVTAIITLLAALGWKTAREDRRTWFAWVMSVPALVAIGVLSLRQSINPNWPAVFHLGALLLAVGWLVRDWPRRAKTWRVAWITGISITGLAYVAAFAGEHLARHGHPKLDLTRRLRGWSELAAKVGEYKNRLETDGGGPVIMVTYGGRALPSELAFYLPGQPRVWHWTPPGVVNSQYALWSGPLPDWRGSRALIVAGGDEPPPEALAAGFSSVRPLGEIINKARNGTPSRVQLWLGENLQSWNHGKPLDSTRSPTAR